MDSHKLSLCWAMHQASFKGRHQFCLSNEIALKKSRQFMGTPLSLSPNLKIVARRPNPKDAAKLPFPREMAVLSSFSGTFTKRIWRHSKDMKERIRVKEWERERIRESEGKRETEKKEKRVRKKSEWEGIRETPLGFINFLLAKGRRMHPVFPPNRPDQFIVRSPA